MIKWEKIKYRCYLLKWRSYCLLIAFCLVRKKQSLIFTIKSPKFRPISLTNYSTVVHLSFVKLIDKYRSFLTEAGVVILTCSTTIFSHVYTTENRSNDNNIQMLKPYYAGLKFVKVSLTRLPTDRCAVIVPFRNVKALFYLSSQIRVNNFAISPNNYFFLFSSSVHKAILLFLFFHSSILANKWCGCPCTALPLIAIIIMITNNY